MKRRWRSSDRRIFIAASSSTTNGVNGIFPAGSSISSESVVKNPTRRQVLCLERVIITKQSSMDLKFRLALVKDFQAVIVKHNLEEMCFLESDIAADYLVSCLQAFTQATIDSVNRDPETAHSHLRLVPALQKPSIETEDENTE